MPPSDDDELCSYVDSHIEQASPKSIDHKDQRTSATCAVQGARGNEQAGGWHVSSPRIKVLGPICNLRPSNGTV